MWGSANDQKSRAQVVQARSKKSKVALEARSGSSRPNWFAACTKRGWWLGSVRAYGKHGVPWRCSHYKYGVQNRKEPPKAGAHAAKNSESNRGGAGDAQRVKAQKGYGNFSHQAFRGGVVIGHRRHRRRLVQQMRCAPPPGKECVGPLFGNKVSTMHQGKSHERGGGWRAVEGLQRYREACRGADKTPTRQTT